jgi:outer membrane protein
MRSTRYVAPVTFTRCIRAGMLALAVSASWRCNADTAPPPVPEHIATQGTQATQTLWSIYKIAHAIAPAEISAHSDFVAQQETAPQALATLLPKIAVTVSNSHDSADLDSGRDTVYPSKGYTISLRQNLFDAPDWQSYQQAKAGVIRARVQYSATEQLLMLQICESYFGVLAAQDDLRFANHHAQMLSDQLDLAKRQYEQADATIVDVQEAEAELGRANADTLAAENSVRKERADLHRRAGIDLTTLAVLPDSADLSLLQEQDEDAWVNLAVTHSPDVEQQRLTQYIAELEVKKSHDAFLPTASVTLSHSAGNLEYLNDQVAISTGGNANSFRQGSSNVAMLQISIPLFDGFSTLSREREARAQNEKADADLDTARLNAEAQEREVYLDLDNAFARARTLDDALRASVLATESNRAAYAVGLRINSDVLRAEDVVYSTQRDLAHSHYDIVLNHLRLRANAGELSDDDMRAVDALLTSPASDPSSPIKQ